LPIEQLHREIGSAPIDAVVEDLDDAWMAQARERVVLALEQHRQAWLLRRFVQQALQRDALARGLVERLIDCTHAAACQLAHDAIATGHELDFRHGLVQRNALQSVAKSRMRFVGVGSSRRAD
jgi:hypothetical protein